MLTDPDTATLNYAKSIFLKLFWRTRRRFGFGLGAVLLAAAGVTANVHAQTAAGEEEPIAKTLNFATAEALDINGLAARLAIETAAEPGIQLSLTGSKRQLEGVHAEESDGTLFIKATAPASASRVTVTQVNGSSTVIVSQGGSASVTIGGNGTSTVVTSDPEPPLQATVRLGGSIPVSIRGLSGSADVAALPAPLELELINGDADLAAVNDASLKIAGSGDIKVNRAEGRLTITIRGSGDVIVDDATLSALEATLRGAGNIDVRGRADRADLAIRGAGTIYVEAVEQQPQRRLSGAGSITVGNW